MASVMESSALGARRQTPDPFSLVIFGASGDLTRRKLVPAVYSLFHEGFLPERFSIVGFARSDMDDLSFAEEMRRAVEEFGRFPVPDESVRGRVSRQLLSTAEEVRRAMGDIGRFPAAKGEAWERFARQLHFVRGDYGDANALRTLDAKLKELSAAQGRRDNRVYDLATPPAVFESIVGGLRESGLARPGGQDGWTRLVIEKPFGRNLSSARELSHLVRSAFSEEQIFRIDHYLGKEAVQNILVFRFANGIFDPLWNQKYIDHVQITVSEQVGMEGRGAYYDRTGALRDMVQNHMMHLLCFLAMESPVETSANSIRDEKVKVLKSLRRISSECAAAGVVRGRYARGVIAGEAAPGYLQEEGVAPDSRTETFVAFKAFIDNWRWAGVPFYLRTGKRLPQRVTEISIHFKPVPQVLFNADPRLPLSPNVLILRIQPDEGISLRFQVKVPGLGMRIEPYRMDFGYGEAFGKAPPEAYERLLLDAAVGDPTLFIRSDEVEAAWEFVGPILEGCAESQSLSEYPAGSWGPREADELIEADGRRWEIFAVAPDAERGAGKPEGD